jgi:hypothetical protein
MSIRDELLLGLTNWHPVYVGNVFGRDVHQIHLAS